MAQEVCEGIWLQILMSDLRILEEGPTRSYYNNKVAISIAHNPVQHDCTKHIEVHCHFIKEKIDIDIICTPFVKLEEQATNGYFY